MNIAYAKRLLQEGKLPCVVFTSFLFVLNLVLSQIDTHPQLSKLHSESLAQSSLSEFAFGIVILSLPFLVLILSLRGLAAEFGRGTLGYLATQVPSRRNLVFTLWMTRALQIAAVLLISLLPFLLRLPFTVVVGAFLWTLISAYLSFALIETLGLMMKSMWRAVIVVFPGIWAVQIVFSILARIYHWTVLDPINYVLSQWLFDPVLLGASANILRTVGVTACWLACFLLLAILCGHWLETTEIKPQHEM
jgi:ABC-type transport system involved in multi-copper enzyme maturation permease subunit